MKKHRDGASAFGHKKTLVSGFTIFVKPLPPYYSDVVEDALPLPAYPKREIMLAAGDKVFWEYKPPETEPSETDEDFELYARWREVDEVRKAVETARELAKRKFLLSNCVTVLEGPYTVDGDGWVQRVEAAFEDYKVPTHPGKRMLIFLQTQVITSVTEMEDVMRLCVAPEVTMQGALAALRGFQGQVA